MLPTDLLRAARGLPGCVGLSVWRVHDGVPTTVLAVDDVVGEPDPLAPYAPTDAAVLDAVQFVATGPGTATVESGGVVEGTTPDVLQRRWPQLAAAMGARGMHGAVAVPLCVAPSVAGSDRWRVDGVVLLYLGGPGGPGGPVVVDARTVRVAEAVGVVALLEPEPEPGPDPDDHDGATGSVGPVMVRLRPEGLDHRLAATGRLLERRLRLDRGVGRSRLVDAADRAGVPVESLTESLDEVLSP